MLGGIIAIMDNILSASKIDRLLREIPRGKSIAAKTMWAIYVWQESPSVSRLYRSDGSGYFLTAENHVGKVIAADRNVDYIRWLLPHSEFMPVHRGYDDMETAKADCLHAALETFGEIALKDEQHHTNFT